MAPTENPLAIGVFRDPTLAEQKAHALRQAGFRDDEIRVWGQGASTVGFLETLMSKWTGQATEAGSISCSLVELGIPQEEADYYQHEVDAGRSVVAVRSYGHRQEGSDILFRAGAYTAQTQPVEVGEVFIRKEIVTEERTITVAVQREEVVIEHRSLRAR